MVLIWDCFKPEEVMKGLSKSIGRGCMKECGVLCGVRKDEGPDLRVLEICPSNLA